MDYSFRLITDEIELYSILMKYNDIFLETIESRVGDLDSYAKKLIQYAHNYVYELDGSVIGIVCFYANDLIKKTAYLTMIAVDEKYIGTGLGSLLLMLCEKKSIEAGMLRITLEVDIRNTRATEFYIRKGYIFTGKASNNTIYMTKGLE